MKKTSPLKNSFNLFRKPLIVTIFGFSTSFTVVSSVQAAPGLMDVYNMALGYDAVLAQAKAEYEAEQQGVATAKSSLLPQVSGTADYGINDNSSNTGAGDYTKFSYGVQATQSIYKKANWATYDRAKFSLEKATYKIKSAEQDIIVRTADAYFKVLIAQEDVSLALSKEEADKTQWERAKASAEVGLASRTDVLQAKSSYDLSRSDRISAENNLDVANEELMKLTGQPLTQLKIVDMDVKLPPQNLDIKDWEKRATSQNLTVLQSEQAVGEQTQTLELEKSGHWFDLGVKANYSNDDYSNVGTASSATANGDNFYIGAYLEMPIYTGGRVTSKVSAARGNLKAANESLRNARNQAALDARVQVRSVERGLSLVDALREAVKSNDAFLEAAEEGYKVGLKNLLEVLTARTNKFKARRDLKEALHNVILARLKLEVAAGSLNEEKLMKYDAILTDPVNAVNVK